MNEYTDGDILTLEHPNGSRMRGRARNGGLLINYDQTNAYQGEFTINTLIKNGFTITNVEKPAPQLPTVPGLYVPTNNAHMLSGTTVWKLEDRGEWKALNGGGLLGPEHALKSLGGLTRLVPEA